MTTGWSVFASYEHFWTPSLRTSIYGTYVESELQRHGGDGDLRHAGQHRHHRCGLPGGAGCDPNWSSWAVGSRSQWNVTKDFYVGLDVIYLKLNTASPNAANLLTIPVTATAAPRRLACTTSATRTPGRRRSASIATSCLDRCLNQIGLPVEPGPPAACGRRGFFFVRRLMPRGAAAALPACDCRACAARRMRRRRRCGAIRSVLGEQRSMSLVGHRNGLHRRAPRPHGGRPSPPTGCRNSRRAGPSAARAPSASNSVHSGGSGRSKSMPSRVLASLTS